MDIIGEVHEKYKDFMLDTPHGMGRSPNLLLMPHGFMHGWVEKIRGLQGSRSIELINTYMGMDVVPVDINEIIVCYRVKGGDK
jgi:hypothetical protein